MQHGKHCDVIGFEAYSGNPISNPDILKNTTHTRPSTCCFAPFTTPAMSNSNDTGKRSFLENIFGKEKRNAGQHCILFRTGETASNQR